MNQQVAQEIVTAGQYLGLHMELREDYSGRGMMGRSTTGLTAASWQHFVGAVGRAVQQSADPDVLIEAAMEVNYDRLGSQLILY